MADHREMLEALGNEVPPKVLPRCGAKELESAIDVEGMSERLYGDVVRVRGRAILGGWHKSCGICVASIGLAASATDEVAPAAGSMVMLTSELAFSRGAAFQDGLYGVFPGTCMVGSKSYCCPWDVIGRELVVTGAVIAPPKIYNSGSSCGGSCGFDHGFAFNPRDPRMFDAVWRTEVDNVAAVALSSACVVDP